MVWTVADVPDQSGRCAIVTGANSGLGLVVARELARAGATVVMACRDVGRGETAASQIRLTAPSAQVAVLPLDLADLSCVRWFAKTFAERYAQLDLLINNAGVMALPHHVTPNGFEMQLGVNHLGHFALTALLYERLQESLGSRVVTVSSALHRMGRMAFSDLQGEQGYRKWRSYFQSKLANLLFAYELARRVRASGGGPRSVAAHPGFAETNLQLVGPRMASSRLQVSVAKIVTQLLAQSAEMGALPILYAATSSRVPNGCFVGPDGLGGVRGYPRVVESSARSRDPSVAKRLWQVSEGLTGMRFDLPGAG